MPTIEYAYRFILVDNIVVIIPSVTHCNKSNKYLGKKGKLDNILGQANDAANSGSGP